VHVAGSCPWLLPSCVVPTVWGLTPCSGGLAHLDLAAQTRCRTAPREPPTNAAEVSPYSLKRHQPARPSQTSFAADPQPAHLFACSTSTALARLAARTYTLTQPLLRFESDRRPTHRRSPVWRQQPTTRAAPRTFRERQRAHAWAKPCFVWPPGPTRSRSRSYVSRTITTARMDEALFDRQNLQRLYPPQVPRAITNPRMGEALFGGPTHDARTNAVLRDEHLAWPPVWDGAS
jgi:hypothetical protein